MGQEEVLNWLKANKGWHAAEKIKEEMGLQKPTLNHILQKLSNHNEICKKKVDPWNSYVYKAK